MNTEETHPHPADHQPQRLKVITVNFHDPLDPYDDLKFIVEEAVTVQQFAAWWWDEVGEELIELNYDKHNNPNRCDVTVIRTSEDGSETEQGFTLDAEPMDVITLADVLPK